MMNKINKVLEIVNDDMLMEMVQEVNSWDNSLDYLNYIDMGFLDDYLIEESPIDIALLIYNGDFNPYDAYFKFNGYGNLESYKDYEVLEDLDYYKEEIVKRFVELYEECHVDIWIEEVKAILDSEEE